MRIPSAYTVICPRCNKFVSITILDAGCYFLADEEWECPHCRHYSTTAEIQDRTDRDDRGGTTTREGTGNV